ncbi:FAD-dependent oxidoreductase [Acetobacterium bakii]|uniref:NADH:ubiquinone reductase (non-electrogenic) n=1 Tax=Acetobacterium bakii TaxID=52689 RepID=A0A0L6U6E1_9FIRM|nr:FAD-dependent oxidoreductase [Acetobacterium bakii]KNZ43335.1 pyridine nucleotide-disulfide oxidoreductase [Acetobacterium bakii]
MEKNIVVLGAGYSGILIAKKLAKRLKKQVDVKITLIDKKSYHTMLTELHEVAGNRVEEDSIRISLKRIFEGRKVDLKIDTITEIDYDKKTLTGKCASYTYDYLVMASGSQPTFFGIPGAKEYSYTLWSYEDAVKIREHVFEMFTKAIQETDPKEKQKLLSFYVLGAGFTGVEMVGELAEWIPTLCEQYEIDPDMVKIAIVDMMDRVVPSLSEKLSEKAKRRLEKMGVTVMLKTGFEAIGEGSISLKQGEQIFEDQTKTVIWAAGIESSEIAKKSGELNQVGRARIKTDEFLRAEGRDDVYIAGDNMYYIPEGQTLPVPQMVENCEQSSAIVAHNLTSAVSGTGEMKKYEPAFHGVMVSIGGRYGISYVGTQNKKFALPSFLSQFVKHFINIIYFIQILGWNKVFSYVRHEFFTIRHCRSFVGGHFSNRTPSFLLVPLRVFLGAFWIYEGVKKVNDGWLQEPNLTNFFQGANDLFYQIVNAGPGGDAVTSATAAAGTPVITGNLLLNWNILGLFKVFLIETTDIAIKFQVGIMDWFSNTVILSSNSSEVFFQSVIVYSEIIIGILLVLGLFTTISSLYSLLLQVMFVTTTGLYLSTWWMVFAAIAVIIGGGRVFGLDYYVMPWLKNHYKNIKIVRKLYIYND